MPFQEAAWAAYERGESGLVHVPTGAGKTYAATLAALADVRVRGGILLYVSPLRAMSRTIEQALKEPVEALGWGLRVETRTGDTAAHVRARQRRAAPAVWITTPESLALLLCEPDAAERFASLRAVVLDEWHELLDAKRGSLLELGLARLRRIAPAMRTWALSATLSNLDEAAAAAVGVGARPTVVAQPVERVLELTTLPPEDPATLPWSGHFGTSLVARLVEWLDPARSPIRAQAPGSARCSSASEAADTQPGSPLRGSPGSGPPPDATRFASSSAALPRDVRPGSTLVFCNTRAQSELWYQGLLALRPEWEPILGLHHGSVEKAEREAVERGLQDGSRRVVVCTASLDLGVDLAPVERVVQVGSPKGIARLLQRAGRSGHRPGAPARVLVVPTHALQLVEIAGVREAVGRREIEPRRPLREPLDVLAQHLVSCALGGGFDADELYAEVCTAWSYRGLSRNRFDAALALGRDGGGTLRAYPQFRKLVPRDGRYVVDDADIAKLHRMSVGTIVGDVTVKVALTNGVVLGGIDEGFIGRLTVGDHFVFAGRVLELVRLRELTAVVRPAKRRTKATPHWPGTRLPISGSLGAAVRRELGRVRALFAGRGAGPEGGLGPAGIGEAASPSVASAEDAAEVPASLEAALAALAPELGMAAHLFRTQAALSRIPGERGLLAEHCRTAEGHHLFVYPFEGRAVHEGLAALLAFRLARRRPLTVHVSVNDHGFELLAPTGIAVDWEQELDAELLRAEGLAEDVAAGVNLGELARRRFRDVARVAGFVNPGLPWAPKSARQLQASAGLLYDVLQRYDPEHLLLQQARREVIEQHLEAVRLAEVLERLRVEPLEWVATPHPTPLAMPLLVERLAVDGYSTEPVAARLERLRAGWGLA